jgi:hypothetical protein
MSKFNPGDSNMQDIINYIINDAKCMYRSFESPDYGFIAPVLVNHWSLYKGLLDNYTVNVDTDFNCDVCMHYYVEKNTISWEICASLVGRYAIVSRKIDDSHWVVVCDDNQTDAHDREILQLVYTHNFDLLSESVLKTVIPGFKFNTFDEDEEGNAIIQDWAYVYQILFFHENYGLISDQS